MICLEKHFLGPFVEIRTFSVLLYWSRKRQLWFISFRCFRAGYLLDWLCVWFLRCLWISQLEFAAAKLSNNRRHVHPYVSPSLWRRTRAENSRLKWWVCSRRSKRSHTNSFRNCLQSLFLSKSPLNFQKIHFLFFKCHG